MRTFVGDDEFVQPKRNETAPRSECRLTFKNTLTQPRLLEMDVKPAIGNSEIAKPGFAVKLPRCRLLAQVDCRSEMHPMAFPDPAPFFVRSPANCRGADAIEFRCIG